ncbi:hypothetical protein D3C80_1757610 [compost metagenome]
MLLLCAPFGGEGGIVVQPHHRHKILALQFTVLQPFQMLQRPGIAERELGEHPLPRQHGQHLYRMHQLFILLLAVQLRPRPGKHIRQLVMINRLKQIVKGAKPQGIPGIFKFPVAADKYKQ